MTIFLFKYFLACVSQTLGHEKQIIGLLCLLLTPHMVEVLLFSEGNNKLLRTHAVRSYKSYMYFHINGVSFTGRKCS